VAAGGVSCGCRLGDPAGRTNWAIVKSGKALRLRGKGYRYEGEFFWDYWSFGGGLDGTLLVEYGRGWRLRF
jgi:hypothetical protein